ncbi:MAG: hypothetical protein Q4C60_01110 [Eubacteriales bacterium]|nr:hypothetical protein [Eubacteriales bacterium]
MFWKCRKKETKKSSAYEVESENLAVPEVHTREAHVAEEETFEEECQAITYDNVAIPEIHVRRKKRETER